MSELVKDESPIVVLRCIQSHHRGGHSQWGVKGQKTLHPSLVRLMYKETELFDWHLFSALYQDCTIATPLPENLIADRTQ
jgi:hypothetical protein